MIRVIVESPYAGLKVTSEGDVANLVAHKDWDQIKETLYTTLLSRHVSIVPLIEDSTDEKWVSYITEKMSLSDINQLVFDLTLDNNVKYAQKCLHDALSRGEAPFASHLLYTQPNVLDDEIPEEREWGIQAGFAWHEVAEYSTTYVDRGVSTGMAYGVLNSCVAGMKVYLRSLDQGWSEELDLSHFHFDLGNPEAIRQLKSKLTEIVDRKFQKEKENAEYHAFLANPPKELCLSDEGFDQLLNAQRPKSRRKYTVVTGADGKALFVKRGGD